MENCSYERFAFYAEWFQEEAHLTRSFILYFFPLENGIEIIDCKSHKTFLRRTRLHDVDERNFYVGAKVNVFGRQFILVDYADEVTRKKLAGRRERGFCLIKSEAIRKCGEIIKYFNDNDVAVSNCVMVELDGAACMEFLDEIRTSSEVNCDTLQPGAVIAMELCTPNAIKRINQLVACNTANSLSNLLPNDLVRHGIYCSQSNEAVQKEIDFFFPSNAENSKNRLRLAARLHNTTLCLIKPHAIKEGKLGDIIMEIVGSGFIIAAMKMFDLPRENCEEFYEVYKGVVSHYLQMAIELSNGPFVALEIAAENPAANVHSDFRQFCGPSDPEIARQLRSNTIRAKYGTNKVQNAVHCTDLEEDCLLELEYFFQILSQ